MKFGDSPLDGNSSHWIPLIPLSTGRGHYIHHWSSSNFNCCLLASLTVIVSIKIRWLQSVLILILAEIIWFLGSGNQNLRPRSYKDVKFLVRALTLTLPVRIRNWIYNTGDQFHGPMDKYSTSYSGELLCELGSENIKIEDFVLILQYR